MMRGRDTSDSSIMKQKYESAVMEPIAYLMKREEILMMEHPSGFTVLLFAVPTVFILTNH